MVADDRIKHKEKKNMKENSKEQETESRPEDAQASEQVKAVMCWFAPLKIGYTNDKRTYRNIIGKII